MDLGFIVSDETVVLAVGVVLMLALIVALTASRRRTGQAITPVTLFFLFAFAHVVFGRYTATLTARYTFVGAATLEPFLDQSFLIISTGLICCFLTYALLPHRGSLRMATALAGISNREALHQMFVRSRLLIVLSIPLIVVGLSQLGGIPLLNDNVRQDRYLMNFLPEHRFDAFLVNRGREIIVIPAAAVALGWFLWKRSVINAFFVGLAVAGCGLTATRSPILTGVLIFLVVLVWGRDKNTVFLIIAATLVGLVASEIALGDSSPRPDGGTTIERIGEDLGEVRDLGWVLSRQDQRYWGLTFLAGMLPIPSFASDFTETYHLRTVTLNAIGFPLTAPHGGLRITYSGEWYINFGWPGVVCGGLLYGWLCSTFSRLFHLLRATPRLYPVGVFVLACVWVAVSFMAYLSSSAAGGTVKTYTAVLIVLCFRLRRSRNFGRLKPSVHDCVQLA